MYMGAHAQEDGVIRGTIKTYGQKTPDEKAKKSHTYSYDELTAIADKYEAAAKPILLLRQQIRKLRNDPT